MFKHLIALSFLIFATTVLGVGKETIPVDTLKLGKFNSLDDKELVFEIGAGASNPKISTTSGTPTFNLNYALDVTGNLDASGDITGLGLFSVPGLDVSPTAATFSNGTDQDFSLIVDRTSNDPFLKWSESAGAWVFSNDGSLEKKIGSGGGGEGGGINLLLNSSFEDPGSPLLNWTNSGGTFTQETFTNGLEDDLKFSKFIATGAGQYIESDPVVIPEDFSFGMMADVRYISGTESFDLVILDSTATITYSSSSFSDLTRWDKKPTDTFATPAPGSLVKMRIVSTGAGTVDLNKAYLGSNKGFISGDGLNVGSSRIQNNGTASIVSQQNDFIESVNRTGLGIVLVTFKAGSFSVAPAVKVTINALNAQATFINTVNLSTSSVEIRSADNGGTFEDRDFSIIITKQGVDAVQAQEAFVPEQANFTDTYATYIRQDVVTNMSQVVMQNVNTGTDGVVTGCKGDNCSVNGHGFSEVCDGTEQPVGGNCVTQGILAIGKYFPTAGEVEVCVDFSIDTQNHTSGFKLVKVSNADSSIIEQDRNGTQLLTNASNFMPVNICEHFSIYSRGLHRFAVYGATSAGLNVAIYTNNSAGTGYANNNAVKFSVKPVSHNVSRPVIQNMVDTSIKSGVRTESCRINNNGTATIDTGSGLCESWIDSVNRSGLGVVDIVYRTGAFSVKPVCLATGEATTTTISTQTGTVSGLAVHARIESTGSFNDVNFYINCIGQR